jgi:YVTN family beta-propeller protein
MKKVIVLSVFVGLMSSCKKDKNEETITPPVVSEGSVYVMNEGNFMGNNASITFINGSGEVTNDPYFDANGVSLGDVLQSMVISNEKVFAVLNNSNKVEVFNVSNFTNVGTISPVDYPRYIVDGGNGKLYLSSGSMAGNVIVINPSTMSIEATIPVGNGPDRMLVENGKLFVCNSGGWSTDNTVSVIDLTTNAVVETITVSDRPADIAADGTGDIWVLCSGETLYDENWNVIGDSDAKLAVIDGTSMDVAGTETIGVNGDHPKLLEIGTDGSTIYYINENVYSLNINDGELPGDVFISGDFNSLDARNNGEIWLSSVTDFVNASSIYRYSSSGVLQNTYTAGIGSNGVYFR